MELSNEKEKMKDHKTRRVVLRVRTPFGTRGGFEWKTANGEPIVANGEPLTANGEPLAANGEPLDVYGVGDEIIEGCI